MADARANRSAIITDPTTGTQQAGVDASGHLQCDIAASSATVTVDLGANNDVVAAGDVAHDGADSGNPIKVGYKALAHGSNPTAVAANYRTQAYANRHGIPWVIGGHPNVVTKCAKNTAAQTDTALVTVGSGTKIVVTRITVTVSNACSVDVDMTVGFGTASTPSPGTGAGTTQVLLDFQDIPAGGGVTVGDGSGILGIGADNADLRYTSSVPTGGSVSLTVSYYTIES